MPLDQLHALTESRRAELLACLAPLLQTTLPITLEIGCGHGHYLTGYAEAHPDRFCIGIDLIADRLERAERKSTRAGLKNIAWVRAEADLFLETLPADTRLAEVFLLFSDPWPKRRHWKNRVLQPDFLTSLAARTDAGAFLYFRTDHEPYFTQAADFVREHRDWELAPEVPWPFELATVFQQRAAAHQSFIARRVNADAAGALRV